MLNFIISAPPILLLTLLFISGYEASAGTVALPPDDRTSALAAEPSGRRSHEKQTTVKAGRAHHQPGSQSSPGSRQPASHLLLHKSLGITVNNLLGDFPAISEGRREKLDRLADIIRGQRTVGQTVKLVFICTHNSRRSQIAQLWAAAAAAFFGVSQLTTYSGGTEVTSFNPQAIAALQRAGFSVNPTASSKPFLQNTHYQVSFSPDRPAIAMFSKKYDASVNPGKHFVAVMTCNHADTACPTVAGASFRIALPWTDPKEADGTPEAASRYDESVREIGLEMLYLFTRVSDDHARAYDGDKYRRL